MDWRLTATTLFCQETKKWVPVLVYRDGKTGCGFHKRQESRQGNGRRPCSGPQRCALCAAYRQDVFQRERQPVKEKEWVDAEKLFA